MILSIENPNDPTQKLLEPINKFSKVQDYIQKSVAFFTLTIKYQKGKVKKTKPFKIMSKKKLRNTPDQGGERVTC